MQGDPLEFDFGALVPAGAQQPGTAKIEGLVDVLTAIRALPEGTPAAPVPALLARYGPIGWIDDLEFSVSDRFYWPGPTPDPQWITNRAHFTLSLRESGAFAVTEHGSLPMESGLAEPVVTYFVNHGGHLFMRAAESETCSVFPHSNGAAAYVLAGRLKLFVEALAVLPTLCGLDGRSCFVHTLEPGASPGKAMVRQSWRTISSASATANPLSVALFGGRWDYEVEGSEAPHLIAATHYPGLPGQNVKRYEFSQQRELAPGIWRPMHVLITETTPLGLLQRQTELRFSGARRAGQAPKPLRLPVGPDNTWAIHTR